MANEILLRLKAPTALREQVVFLISQHMTPLEAEKPLLRRRLGQYGEALLRQLLLLQKADFCSKGTEEEAPDFQLVKDMIGQILQEQACLTVKDLAVGGNDLMDLGVAPGPELGACLNHLLEQVQTEQLPNEKEPLLAEALNYFQL